MSYQTRKQPFDTRKIWKYKEMRAGSRLLHNAVPGWDVRLLCSMLLYSCPLARTTNPKKRRIHFFDQRNGLCFFLFSVFQTSVRQVKYLHSCNILILLMVVIKLKSDILHIGPSPVTLAPVFYFRRRLWADLEYGMTPGDYPSDNPLLDFLIYQCIISSHPCRQTCLFMLSTPTHTHTPLIPLQLHSLSPFPPLSWQHLA